MPASRRCNIRLVDDTAQLFHSVRRSLPHPTARAAQKYILAANTAARQGQCAQMHAHAQAARGLLERRLDAMLGPPRRR